MENVDGAEPVFYAIGPGGDGEFGDAAEAVAVAAFGVEVEFGGDFGLFEGEEIGGGVFYVDWVVFCLNDEGGRGLGGGMDVELVEVAVFGVGEVAGVDDDGEVGAAGLLVGGVDGGVEPFVVVGAEGDGEVGSGGEAEDADAVGIDLPFSGVGADQAYGALRVVEGCGGFGHVGAGVGDAVLEQDAGDAFGVEPVADFSAFEVDGENVVSAAGEDDYGCAGAGGLWARRG